MKKRQLFIIAPAIFAFGALVGCKNNTTTYKVTFDYCYDGKQPDVVSVEANKSVNRPNEPTRENYRFVDWFTEKDYQNIYIISLQQLQKTLLFMLNGNQLFLLHLI